MRIYSDPLVIVVLLLVVLALLALAAFLENTGTGRRIAAKILAWMERR